MEIFVIDDTNEFPRILKKAYCDVNHPGETIFSRKLNIELREKIAILAWVTRSSLIWASSSYKIIYVVAIFVTNNCASILIDVDFCNGGAFIIQSNILIYFFSRAVWTKDYRIVIYSACTHWVIDSYQDRIKNQISWIMSCVPKTMHCILDVES